MYRRLIYITHVVKVDGGNDLGKHIAQPLRELEHVKQVTQSLFEIAKAVNTSSSLDELYKAIHQSLKPVMEVENFFIAIANREKRTLFFPYHSDIMDDDFCPIDDFDTETSLTGLVVKQGRPMLLKKDELEKRAHQKKIWGPVPLIWMGVPLRVEGSVIGIIAVQSYTDPECYTRDDLDFLVSVSDHIAIAIARKQAEEKLQASEARYRILFEKSMDAILIIRNHILIDCNQAAIDMLGYDTRESLLEKHPGDLSPQFQPDGHDSFAKAAEMMDIALENGSHRFEWAHVRANGEVFPVEVSLTVISSEPGNQVIHTVLRDITEQKLAEQEKQRISQLAAEQEKHALVGKIAGKMAHDFNNILGVIMGNAELALLDCEDYEMRKTLDLIYDQTIKGKSLTKNLTAFAKDQAPRHEFLELNDIIELVIDILKKDLAPVNMVKDYDQNLPDLVGDHGMMEHILINLLQNSVHALSLIDNPEIVIRTFSDDNHICFEIKDNGCGIPDEYIEEIFEPAFTLKGSRDTTGSYARHIKGTGYGMSNVKKYIEQHNGKISVESRLNTGTRVKVCFPLIKRQLTSLEKQQLSAMKPVTGKYILLVEDETALSDVQYRILTHSPFNHRVDIAMNGQMAIDLFSRNHYDLVSLDYQLPGRINGMDVYKRIRTISKTIPVLFVSGNLEFLESIDEFKNRKFIDFLSKPCLNKVYARAVNQLLQNNLSALK